jgi:hypothetical protein
MRDRDDEPDAGLDDFDRAARINFRDYPSSAVVVIAALGSGLAWAFYRWFGRKGAARQPASADIAEAKDAARQTKPSSAGDV